MIQIRLRLPCRREFERDVYRPGVISLTRLLWGSAGAGLFLLLIAFFSDLCQVGVLYPPLAATCFLSATCVYLRVARPRQVIAGHFVSAVGGLLAVFAVTRLVDDPALAVPLKLGLAVGLATVFMQVFDADHPPAAATAAIPAILPLPVDPLSLPVHMAWGAVLAVLLSLAWNRIWFEYPAQEDGACPAWGGIHMDRAEVLGFGACVAGFVLMALRPVSPFAYLAGVVVMFAGVSVLLFQHFFTAEIVCGDPPSDLSGRPPLPPVRGPGG
ncbi:HPP family protein [Desulfolutivibrio sulfoxidireducens]|uniref:HPP family protein n=1 Tax=Desulfolutivibrio sulfoxidireducens TaxID=2773299 RepID=UPI00159DC989|nr:HPP family protein [Desulfolutivibrio sulfoxidireducens]QLA17657.1 HPP family protein [Desulfolutivibrio sulfoxidireducens]